MVLHRVRREAQRRGDRCRVRPLQHEGRHVLLPCGQAARCEDETSELRWWGVVYGDDDTVVVAGTRRRWAVERCRAQCEPASGPSPHEGGGVRSLRPGLGGDGEHRCGQRAGDLTAAEFVDLGTRGRGELGVLVPAVQDEDGRAAAARQAGRVHHEEGPLDRAGDRRAGRTQREPVLRTEGGVTRPPIERQRSPSGVPRAEHDPKFVGEAEARYEEGAEAPAGVLSALRVL